jgi:integrase
MSRADLANTSVSLIREKHLDQWLNDRERTDKAASRRVDLASLRSFFNFCSIRKYTDGDPSKLVSIKWNLLTHAQKEARVRQPFTDAEVAALLNATDPRAHADVDPFWFCAIAIGRYTGLRLGDICSLEWDCFAAPGKMKVWTNKSDTSVLLPLDRFPVLQDAVAMIPYQDKAYCFPTQREAITDPRRRAYISVQFGRLCASLDILGKSFHSFRHTYASAEKTGLEQIAMDLGHHSTKVTKGYIHE